MSQGSDDAAEAGSDGEQLEQVPSLQEWRVGFAEDLGFSPLWAEFLATAQVDLHFLRRLLQAGATHNQVLRIVL